MNDVYNYKFDKSEPIKALGDANARHAQETIRLCLPLALRRSAAVADRLKIIKGGRKKGEGRLKKDRSERRCIASAVFVSDQKSPIKERIEGRGRSEKRREALMPMPLPNPVLYCTLLYKPDPLDTFHCAFGFVAFSTRIPEHNGTLCSVRGVYAQPSRCNATPK